ncbi:hypothetical protein C8F04DRAFT_1232969 [Mycena alexandri]|uniref:Uncharacterized protein n=1 Tax=Mycena alexandri TaxID=1745969 RepID=A0AAD6X2R2_9AGAR|nr:hypothetical protein C8F04DRAFT_1232969 [Mycena alexandri]
MDSKRVTYGKHPLEKERERERERSGVGRREGLNLRHSGIEVEHGSKGASGLRYSPLPGGIDIEHLVNLTTHADVRRPERKTRQVERRSQESSYGKHPLEKEKERERSGRRPPGWFEQRDSATGRPPGFELNRDGVRRDWRVTASVGGGGVGQDFGAEVEHGRGWKHRNRHRHRHRNRGGERGRRRDNDRGWVTWAGLREVYGDGEDLRRKRENAGAARNCFGRDDATGAAVSPWQVAVVYVGGRMGQSIGI